jgi:hypothetical protein
MASGGRVCADIRPLRLLASDPGAIVETTPRVHSTYFGFSSSGSLAMLAAILPPGRIIFC